MSDIEYWHQLLPDHNITDQPFHSQKNEYRFTDSQVNLLARQIKKEGYFQSTQIVPTQAVEPLAQTITRINQARIMPVFAAVYDEFWRFLYSFRNTFNTILGVHYRLTPDFWVWQIEPSEAARGWSAHRDAQLSGNYQSVICKDGSPKLCTVWIPLTDATTHNSCIYVLPFPHDPAIKAFLQQESPEVIQQQMASTDWSNVRALPVSAGSILGWSPYILHWGSASTDWATHARTSIGIYYEAANAPMCGRPFDHNGRQFINTSDKDIQISLEDRLTIIANILSIYISSGHMDSEPNFSTAVKDFCQRWAYER